MRMDLTHDAKEQSSPTVVAEMGQPARGARTAGSKRCILVGSAYILLLKKRLALSESHPLYHEYKFMSSDFFLEKRAAPLR
jgi:hypothetical protein